MRIELGIFWVILSIAPLSIYAQEAFTVATYHNLSIYWSPEGGSIDNPVSVAYKVSGTNTWLNGLDLKYNPIINCGINPHTGVRYDKADYRGCLANLTPDTTYDIRLILENVGTISEIQATTWTENYPIGTTVIPSNSNTELEIHDSGTPNAYLLYDGTGVTIDIQDNSEQCISLHNVEYVIIRGFTLKNGGKYGIRLYDCQNVIIENCDISLWGEEDIPGTGFGINYQSGIYAHNSNGDAIKHSTIQRNRIHHPKWDTNSWAELHDPSEDPGNPNNYHPAGPQGIAFSYCDTGNNVIRYNEIWSDEDHYFNDLLGFGPNASYSGFPGPDSDIYGNYLANCFDDGIESEGSNTNVRIWNNFIEEVFLAIGNAATSVGPLYVWRNVSGRAYSHPGSVYGDYGGFIKMGYANSIDWMTGHMYIFNNTILQVNDHGTGGLGTSQDSNRYIFHCETRNNIFHTRNSTVNSISLNPSNSDNSFDYDLLNHPFPNDQEVHGISGIPNYLLGAPAFDFNNKTGTFELSELSDGYDDGIIIPNFIESYTGNAPDMGAHESGWEDFIYGINANFVPLPPNFLYDVDEEEPRLSIFPNPANKTLQILDKHNNRLVSVKIFDSLSKLIYDNPIYKYSTTVNISQWKTGVYIVQILTEDKKKYSQKLIIK